MGFYLEEALTSLRKEPNRMLPSEVNKKNFPQTISPRISMSCLFFNRPFYSQLRTSPFSLQILTSERPLAMSSSVAAYSFSRSFSFLLGYLSILAWLSDVGRDVSPFK